VAIPRNKFVVITGLSGSGKSSLAFDTLFAEGQRMYVESLSSYARQFLGRMEKPDVEYIKGVAPAIAIQQKVNTKNPRSTVGTTTEIYDYLKLLFSRIGKTYSPISGNEVKHNTVTDIVDYILSFEEGDKVMISCPLQIERGRKIEQELELLLQKGYTRILIDGEVFFLEELIGEKKIPKGKYEILIDRASVLKDDEDNQFMSNITSLHTTDMDGIVQQKPKSRIKITESDDEDDEFMVDVTTRFAKDKIISAQETKTPEKPRIKISANRVKRVSGSKCSCRKQCTKHCGCYKVGRRCTFACACGGKCKNGETP
jgi:excinuclease UvrABC ATPase subunit